MAHLGGWLVPDLVAQNQRSQSCLGQQNQDPQVGNLYLVAEHPTTLSRESHIE